MTHIPADPIADLVSVLDISKLSDTEFEGRTQWMPQGRVFGGQVLAQSLVAATRTVASDRRVHSLHSYFLRPGDIEKTVRFSVEILRDGRSFSARRVHAIQDDKPIFSMIASFQLETPGLTHEEAMPESVDPETLPSASDLLSMIDHPATNYWSKARPFDLRHVGEPVYLRPAKEQRPNQQVWFKAISELENDPLIHTAALAYASDYTILEAVIRNHNLSWAHPGLSAASLDHAIWFHAVPNLNDWHLYSQQSPAASNGRGLSQGKIYSQQGKLIATVAQEGMIRIPD
jgi:acyl-CoA thioesterase II